eukprot:SM000034S12789  [mRNA]  locus=s34:748402:751003:- [translate_table: standard]
MAARRGSPDGQAGDVAAGVELVANERAAGATRPRDQAGQRKRGLVAGAAHAAGPGAAAPPPPPPPPLQELYFGLFTLRTAGAYLYDAAENRSRVDRADGRGDRYCGTAAPLSATPCSHLVVDGVRYLLFPDLRYCCTCCTAANGCGILARDWLAGAAYLGSDEVDGVVCDKWNKPGLQNNYYWQTPAGVPIRIYQEYAEMMTFRPDTYTTSPDFVDDTFSLPEYSELAATLPIHAYVLTGGAACCSTSSLRELEHLNMQYCYGATHTLQQTRVVVFVDVLFTLKSPLERATSK